METARAYFSGVLMVENTAVSIPVKAYTLADKTGGTGLSKRSLCCNSFVRYNEVCGKCGQTLTSDLVGRGYNVGDEMIPIDTEQLEAIKPVSNDSIIINGVLDEYPLALDTDLKYLLRVDEVKDKKTKEIVINPQIREAYSLLANGLKASGKVLIGRVVVRQKEHVVAITPINHKGETWLMLNCLFWNEQLKEQYPLDYEQPKPQDVKQITGLLNGLPKAELGSYKDGYAENLKRLIKKEPIVQIKAVAPKQVSNALSMFIKDLDKGERR